MYHLTEAYLMAGFICLVAAYVGALVFAAGTVAPLVVQKLDEEAAAAILRPFWVRYHRFAVIGALAFSLTISAASFVSAVPLVYSTGLVACASAMTLCFYIGMRLINAINAARDEGNVDRFNALHRTDVMLVGIGLLLGITLICGLVYVLPGQFTFWPTDG